MSLLKSFEPWLIDVWLIYRKLKKSFEGRPKKFNNLHAQLAELEKKLRRFERSNDLSGLSPEDLEIDWQGLEKCFLNSGPDTVEVITLAWCSNADVIMDVKEVLDREMGIWSFRLRRYFSLGLLYRFPRLGLVSGLQMRWRIPLVEIDLFRENLELASRELERRFGQEFGLGFGETRILSGKDLGHLIATEQSEVICTALEWRFDVQAAQRLIQALGTRQALIAPKTRVRLGLLAKQTESALVPGWEMRERAGVAWREISRGALVAIPEQKSVGKNIFFVGETEAVMSPPAKIAILSDVKITAGGTVFDDQSIFEIEDAANPSFNFVSGRWEHVVGSAQNFTHAGLKVPPPSETSIPQGILLSGRNDVNWFHLLVEYLPRLFYTDTIPAEVPFLISKRWPKSAIEALAVLSSRNVLVIDENIGQKVGTLFVIGSVGFHPDDINLINTPKTFAFRTDALISLRQTVLKKIPIQPNLPRRVYFDRKKGARGLRNRGTVATILRCFGFSIFDPFDLSFEKQVQLLHSAEVVAFPGGATMANLLFSKPGQRVLMFCSRENSTYKMPWILANLAGAQIVYLVGRSVHAPFNYSYLMKLHRNYTVPALALIATLLKLTQSTDHQVA